jgi:hypothetical protein
MSAPDLNITKEWIAEKAALEGDGEIGAGVPAYIPPFIPSAADKYYSAVIEQYQSSVAGLTARIIELEEENAKLREALKSVPRKPGVTCTSHEWDLDDQAQGWSDAFHTSQVRSCRSAGYDKGMRAVKAARAALQGGSNG